MRANSAAFIEIVEECRDIFGAISRSIAWIVSLVCAPARHQKIDETRSSGRPTSSSAASVFSIVGSSGLSAIASISAPMRGKCRVENRAESIVGDAAKNPAGRAARPMRSAGCGRGRRVSSWAADEGIYGHRARDGIVFPPALRRCVARTTETLSIVRPLEIAGLPIHHPKFAGGDVEPCAMQGETAFALEDVDARKRAQIGDRIADRDTLQRSLPLAGASSACCSPPNPRPARPGSSICR